MYVSLVLRNRSMLVAMISTQSLNFSTLFERWGLPAKMMFYHPDKLSVASISYQRAENVIAPIHAGLCLWARVRHSNIPTPIDEIEERKTKSEEKWKTLRCGRKGRELNDLHWKKHTTRDIFNLVSCRSFAENVLMPMKAFGCVSTHEHEASHS